VLDAWFDSGSMPSGQFHYPFENEARFERRFPADFICEAIDQTRGWFYSLLAVNTLVFGRSPYRNVVCHAHVVDQNGSKMSKSKGNVIDPWTVLDSSGADALRWYFFSAGSPWTARRVFLEGINESSNRFLRTLWNTYSFFVTYANLDGWSPDPVSAPARSEHVLDRWIRSRVHGTVEEVTDALEGFDALRGAQALEALVDDLSNWYVRRSRPRFWKAADPHAHATLHEALTTIALLLAPFTPFVAEVIWRSLSARDGAADSVHLTDYPESDDELIDEGLDEAMAAARGVVGLGRTIRVETKTKVRQPLAEAVVHYAGDHAAMGPLLEVIAEELNVQRVVFAESADELGTWRAKPNFRVLGPALGSRVQEVSSELDRDDGSTAAALARGETVTVHLPSGEVTLSPDDVDLTQDVREGWGVASEGGLTVALDLELSDELRREGVARELIRVIQDARKAAGFEVTDRIQLGIVAGPRASEALATHREIIAGETLAVDLILGDVEGSLQEGAVDGEPVRVTVRRADYAAPGGS
jgi:isoleucyl-tRNA synthetase